MKKLLVLLSIAIGFVSSPCPVKCSAEIYLNSYYNPKQLTATNSTYVVSKRLNLHGQSMKLPAGCTLRFEDSAYIYNGLVILNNTELEGNPKIKCRMQGTLANDSIDVSWFAYTDHMLFDLFSMAEGKAVFFPEDASYDADYEVCIPSCTVHGHNSQIRMMPTDEHSSVHSMVKIRNQHFEGGGFDTIVMDSLHFVTSADKTFLFSLQFTRDTELNSCSFVCEQNSGKTLSCVHALDLRGNNINTIICGCYIENYADTNEGGGLWIRSFGKIDDVLVKDCQFFNTCHDEFFALNAVDSNIYNIIVENCTFKYRKGNNSKEPNVFWGLTDKNGFTNSNITFSNCSVESDFLPSYIINTNKAQNVAIKNCSFNFNGAVVNCSELTTTGFSGVMDVDGVSVEMKGLICNPSSKSHMNLFGRTVTVRLSEIANDCPAVQLGCADIENSNIDFNHSQLFSGDLPKNMVGCTIHLGSGSPELVANPFSHTGSCEWRNNKIRSDRPVWFNFSYKNVKVKMKGCEMNNIKVVGNE